MISTFTDRRSKGDLGFSSAGVTMTRSTTERMNLAGGQFAILAKHAAQVAQCRLEASNGGGMEADRRRRLLYDSELGHECRLLVLERGIVRAELLRGGGASGSLMNSHHL